MQSLYAWQCGNHQIVPPDIQPIIDHITGLDALIAKHAPRWPLEKINLVDLSILRCCFWELTHTPTPPKVVIDESIELAKEFGTENSSSFINGVIGSSLVELNINP
jgi:N utilization substance protein B